MDNLIVPEQGKEVEHLIRSASWNLAAVNNNPFEYWITFDDPNYDSLMEAVENFVCNRDRDLRVDQIFSDSMFSELTTEMEANEIGSLDKLRDFWENDYKSRLAISGFLKDKAIGTKRLSSMPDRITNTINLSDGTIFRRPTAISAYQGPSIGSVSAWWLQWKKFMFHSEVRIFEHGEHDAPQKVCNLLSPILRSKYPAITMEEQEISIQLQLLCLAILDAIFIFILNASGSLSWERVRETLCNSLIFNKASTTCEIIARSYSDTPIFFIQEAAAIFTQKAVEHEALSRKYFIVSPSNLDGKRNQNSLILLDRAVFAKDSLRDVTQLVVDSLDGVFITAGDLLAVTVRDFGGCSWFLVSFHGDSNGLSAQPVLTGVLDLALGRYAGHRLLCGMDANTYSGPPDRFYFHVESFNHFVSQNGLISLWGGEPDPALRTTFSCRTYLQTQLNKAVPMAARFSEKHHNLKDWIVAFAHQVTDFLGVERDNTGLRRFAPKTVLPSVNFPSDHVIVSAAIALAPLQPHSALNTPRIDHLTVASSTRGSNSACSQGRRRSVFQDRVSAQKTLYDYWGIGEKPLASTQLQQACEPPSLCVGPGPDNLTAVIAPGSTEMSAQMEDLRFRMYRRFVGKDRSQDFDQLSMLRSTREDRSIWIPFGQRPTSMALCKSWFQFIMSSAGVSLLAETAFNIWFVATQSSVLGSAFRFVAVTTRNGSRVLPGPLSVRSVGLLQNGVVRLQHGGEDAVDGIIVLNLTAAHAIDGFFVETGGADLALDPQEYRWDRLDEAGSWEQVRYPAWMARGNVAGLPERRFTARVMDFRPPLSWLVDRVFCLAFISITMNIAPICGQLEMSDLGVLVYGIPFHFLFVSAMWQVVTYASMADDGGVPLAIGYVLHGITHLCYGNCSYQQRYQVDMFLVAAVCFCAAKVLIYLESFLFDGYPWLNWILLNSVAFNPVLCSASLIALRSLTWSWVLGTMTKPDRQGFENAWEAVLESDGGRRTLERLVSLCSSLHVTPCAVQQIAWPSLRVILHPKAVNRRRSWMPRQFTSGRRLLSLDQLYDQAVCLEFFLRQKILSISQGCNGCFKVQSSVDSDQDCFFATLSEIMAKKASGVGLEIRWAQIKYPERALEKLIRAYDCDVSRLVDCCRGSLYFKDVQDLVTCLEVIAADKEISVRRIKNRMDPTFDTTRSGGFRFHWHIIFYVSFLNMELSWLHRNVSINFCIESEETRRLGVDGHICELLLVLTSFAELVDDSEHGRYLVLRNCRDAPHLTEALMSRWSAVTQCFKFSTFRRSPIVFPNIDDCESFASDALHGANPHTEATAKPINLHSQGSKLEAESVPAPNALSLEDQCGAAIEHCLRDVMKTTHRRLGALHDRVSEDALEIIGLQGCTMWSTPHPLAAALFKPQLKWMLALFVAANIAEIAYVGYVATVDDQVSALHFRFTALQLRDSSIAVRAPGISSLGVFCKQDRPSPSHSLPPNYSSMNQTYTISFATLVSANGWWFETSSGAPELDPVRFYLESSMDGTQWDKIGSSSSVWTWSGKQFWTDGYYSTSLGRETRIVFDSGVPWVWAASHILNSFICIFMVFCLTIVKALKNEMMARILVAQCSFGIALIFASLFAVCVASAQAPMAITAIVQALSLIIFSYVVWFKESRVIFAIGFCGVVWILNVVVHHVVLVGEPRGLLDRTSVFANHGLWSGVCFTTIFCFASIVRWHSWVRSKALVSEDLIRNDECWQSIVQADQPHAYLKMLDQRVSDISSNSPSEVRQRIQPDKSTTPIRASSSATGAHPVGDSIEDGECPLVHSLDQLFAQAEVVDVLLRDKMRAWALASRGLAMIASERERSFLLWSEVVADQDMLKQVRFAALKSRRRATEKLYRHHGSDVSRLLDVCRQSIYFRGLDDMGACLDALAADPEAHIRCVSSTMRLGRDAAATIGFRFVRVHLSLRSALAQRLGVDMHVCELLLVLVPFAKPLSDAGHARYIAWKDQFASHSVM